MIVLGPPYLDSQDPLRVVEDWDRFSDVARDFGGARGTMGGRWDGRALGRIRSPLACRCPAARWGSRLFVWPERDGSAQEAATRTSRSSQELYSPRVANRPVSSEKWEVVFRAPSVHVWVGRVGVLSLGNGPRPILTRVPVCQLGGG